MKIAIIPARGGSKRIKNKNIIDFFGKPMIAHILDAARRCGLFDVIHVSTDNSQIASIVEGLGFSVDFMRDSELADDQTPIMPVMRWVLGQYLKRGKEFDEIGLLLPCAPLVESADLKQAYELFRRHGGEKPLMAVAPFPVPVEWAYVRKDDGALVPVNPGAAAIRSQDLGKKYFDSGTFYFYSSQHILSDRPATDRDYISYLLPRTKAVDIDDEDDLALAKALFGTQR